MSIQVVNNSAPAAQAEKPAVQGEVATSAPVAEQAAEQTVASVPETEESKANEESEETEAEGDESDAAVTEDGKPKKKSGSQRRKERAERAEAEVERLRRVVEDMALKGAGGSKPDPKPVEPAKVEAEGKPNPETFDTHAGYVEALTDWKIEQGKKRDKEEATKAQFKTDQEKLFGAHHDRERAFAEKTADYKETLEGVDFFKDASPVLLELIVSSVNGPDLMYALAKNSDEYERINRLSPLAAAREMGKLEAKFVSHEPKKPETKTVTNAPKPLTPVGGKGGVVEKSITDPNLSQREYEAIRHKQLAARKAAW